MDTKVFDEQMGRLRNTFGAANYNPEKTKLIWAEVRAVPNKQAIDIFNFMIGEFQITYPPRVSHFREQAELQLKRIWESQTSKSWKEIDEIRHTDSNDGLNKAIEALNARSLLDAIRKTRSVKSD